MSTFSKTMSSLRSKLFSSNKNIFSSQPINPEPFNLDQPSEAQMSMIKPEITVTPSVNSIVSSPSSKQLTISNVHIQCNDTLPSPSSSSSHLNVSMHTPQSNNASFTVQTTLNTDTDKISNSKSPVSTPLLNTDNIKPNSLFNSLKGFKNKKSKSRSPKKKK